MKKMPMRRRLLIWTAHLFGRIHEILVTGGAGFIGPKVIRTAINLGHSERGPLIALHMLHAKQFGFGT